MFSRYYSFGKKDFHGHTYEKTFVNVFGCKMVLMPENLRKVVHSHKQLHLSNT